MRMLLSFVHAFGWQPIFLAQLLLNLGVRGATALKLSSFSLMACVLPTGYLSVTTMKYQGEAITRRLSKTKFG